MRARIAVCLGLLCSLTLLPVGASAQTSGTIAGLVTDSSGAVLPGVTVEAASPALIEQVRTVVTDGAGRYNLVDLRPGLYTVTFGLPGFATVIREGLELTTGATLPVNTELRVGAIGEQITVTGATPVVDVQSTRSTNVIDRDLLTALPQSKTTVAYAALTPGMKLRYFGGNNQDVGGSFGEQPSSVSINGGSWNDTVFMVNGMRQNLGGSSLRLYFESSANIQEISIETSGAGAESPTGGVQMNFVPKEGSNIYSGFFGAQYTNQSLQGTNIGEGSRLRQRGLSQKGAQDVIYDYEGNFGGPFIQDKLWFFTGHRWWGSKELVPGTFFNATQGTGFWTPDRDRQGFKDAYFEDHSLRLTWQVASNNKLVISHAVQNNCQCFFGLGSFFAPEASANLRYKIDRMSQLNWTYSASSRLLIEAGMTHGEFDPSSPHVGFERGSELPPATPIFEVSTVFFYQSGSGYRGAFGPTVMDQNNARVSATYVTGTHTLKAGLYMFYGWDDNTIGGIPDPPIRKVFFDLGGGSVETGFQNQFPSAITQYLSPRRIFSRSFDIGYYVQDSWVVNRATINAGLRLDTIRAWTPAIDLPATFFVPALSFAREDNLPNWKDISPRVGVAYDLTGDARTAIKASFGRYSAYLSASIAKRAAAVGAVSTSTGRSWFDANGDREAQESELGPVQNTAFGTVNIVQAFAPEYLEGWGDRNHNWQASVSLQHQLAPGIGLNVGYHRISFNNFEARDNTALLADGVTQVSSANYDEYCVTAPTDTRLGRASGSEICGLYDIGAAAFGRSFTTISNSTDFGNQTEVFNGFDVTLDARFDNGASLGGGLNGGRTTTDNCEIKPDSPDRRFCHQTRPIASNLEVKLNGVYPLPWWGLQASAVLQNLPGIPILANLSYAAAATRFVGDPTRTLTNASRVTINNLIDPWSEREVRLTQVDVRLTKIFQAGPARIQGAIDIYNLFNHDGVLALNNTFGTDWQRPLNVMGARIAKFGFQVNW